MSLTDELGVSAGIGRPMIRSSSPGRCSQTASKQPRACIFRGMFEVYNAQVDAAAAAEEAEADRAARAVIEREAEAVRQGRPPHLR
jgi:hypothetical protein